MRSIWPLPRRPISPFYDKNTQWVQIKHSITNHSITHNLEPSMKIRACEKKDIPSLCDIYNYYITDTVITFEDSIVSHSEMGTRVKKITQSHPWLVCEVNNTVVGYAYANQWKDRAAYKHSIEVTVYVNVNLPGKGYGKALYSHLIQALESSGCHAIIGIIALPNTASVAIHEHFGLKKVAHFSEVGFKFGRWIDVGFWQKTLPSKL